MNRLDPDLKRLLRRSRPAVHERPDAAPFGFAGRVVAGWSGKNPESKEPGLHRLFAAVAGLACLLILGSGLFLFQQTRTPGLASDFSSAAQFVANTLAP
jgi:hypothetical protein